MFSLTKKRIIETIESVGLTPIVKSWKKENLKDYRTVEISINTIEGIKLKATKTASNYGGIHIFYYHSTQQENANKLANAFVELDRNDCFYNIKLFIERDSELQSRIHQILHQPVLDEYLIEIAKILKINTGGK
jgi:hypothetical protein